MLLDRVEHGDTLVGSLEVDLALPYLHLRRAEHLHADVLQHLLGEVHHPVVVLIGDIDLHGGELGVVRAVHPLVAEVAAELVDALEATDDEALEVELVGDTQVERDVQRIVMRDEGARRCSARDRLQDGRVHLDVAAIIEELAHRREGLRTLEEDVLHPAIDHEVDVALAEAQLRVREAIEGLAVLLLDHGQWTQRLRKEGQAVGVDGDLPHLSAEDFALHADEVTNIHQFLHHAIVERLVLSWAELVARDIDLYASRSILQLEEGGLPHDTTPHDTSCHTHLAAGSLVLKAIEDLTGMSCHFVLLCGIRVDAKGAKLFQTTTAEDLLLAQL